MIVSWNWLKQYVSLDMPVEELTYRLMMAGINHEGTAEIGGDLAMDLEITSNRPDCLSHLGIAREVAALFGRALRVPEAQPSAGRTPVESLVQVRIECPDLCFRYIARVIRGVRIGPSPGWLMRRLRTVGLTPINNVVDVSNYVLMECGQPLHTFDFAKVRGGTIVVRRPRAGETIEAINHIVYPLQPDMCIICDAECPVAIGGVMGGAETEISDSTTDVLIESAEFAPVSIRNTARALGLHSDSSFRFERGVDPEGVDWASRRCCELILELAGGELADGVVDVGRRSTAREPIPLRFAQIPRILGIDVPPERVREILLALGLQECSSIAGAESVPLGVSETISETKRRRSSPRSKPVAKSVESDRIVVLPPSWRRDLEREIDLVEEVARLYGYDKIPEDVSVPMAPSARSQQERVLEKVRGVLTGCGLDEAMTFSVVEEELAKGFLPWTLVEPLRTQTPILRGANVLRESLVPSLLSARRTNESLGNPQIELFEIATVYWPQPDTLPIEEPLLSITSGRSYLEVKGILEALLEILKISEPLRSELAECSQLAGSDSCRLYLGDQLWGFVGEVSAELQQQMDLRRKSTTAEVRIRLLVQAAQLTPQYQPVVPYPPITRDVNLVVDEAVRWADVATTIRHSGGPWLESLQYRQTYRDTQRLGQGKKSLLMTLAFRCPERTLTNPEADQLRDQIVAECEKRHGAKLRAG